MSKGAKKPLLEVALRDNLICWLSKDRQAVLAYPLNRPATFLPSDKDAMTVYIYTLSDPETHEVRYVGKTVDLKSRFSSHLRDQRKNIHKTNWIMGLSKRGVDPIIEELERIENSNDSDWQEIERFWIVYLRFLGCRLCNLDNGGRGGTRKSEETRAKMSAARLGTHPTEATMVKMRLKTISPETRAKISKAQCGRKLTDEHRRKMALGNKGKIRTSQHIEKYREIARGRTPGEKCRIAQRASTLGKKLSVEHRAKLSSARLGKKLSATHKLAMSLVRIGKKHPRRRKINQAQILLSL